MNQNTQIDTKSINNAISSYLMIFISGFFLLNKDNQYINNSFVRSHVKRAVLLHVFAFFNYLIFISFSFLAGQSIFEYQLNYLIASIVFLFILGLMLYGIYLAYTGRTFSIKKLASQVHSKKIILKHENEALTEQDKMSLILSFVPFIGYIVHGLHYKNNSHIKNIVGVNVVLSLFIMSIYISGYSTLSLVFLLGYIVLAVFLSVNLIVNNVIFFISTTSFYSFEDMYIFLKSSFLYLKRYFGKKDFIGIQTLYGELKQKSINNEIYNDSLLNTKKDIPFSKIIIYVPFLNIICLFFLQTKQRFHIINGLVLTALFIFLLILSSFGYHLYSFIFFPIFFGIGFLYSRTSYKMPFIFDVFEVLSFMKNKIISGKNIIKTKSHEEHEEKHIVKD